MRSLATLVSIIAVATVLGAPSLARASHPHGDHDSDDRGAPEPLTVIGLGLGAAGIGAARWAYGRRSSRKKG
jgi:hypothetical protein